MLQSACKIKVFTILTPYFQLFENFEYIGQPNWFTSLVDQYIISLLVSLPFLIYDE
tara:strand:+ start:203 stop:370 length:168 start_codon:yes stop_codon:yes gene_type:complete